MEICHRGPQEGILPKCQGFTEGGQRKKMKGSLPKGVKKTDRRVLDRRERSFCKKPRLRGGGKKRFFVFFFFAFEKTKQLRREKKKRLDRQSNTSLLWKEFLPELSRGEGAEQKERAGRKKGVNLAPSPAKGEFSCFDRETRRPPKEEAILAALHGKQEGGGNNGKI